MLLLCDCSDPCILGGAFLSTLVILRSHFFLPLAAVFPFLAAAPFVSLSSSACTAVQTTCFCQDVDDMGCESHAKMFLIRTNLTLIRIGL